MIPANPAYTDSKGRTTADRIAAVADRRTTPTPADLQQEARLMLESMLLGAALHCDATIDDFDWVGDLPAMCLDVVVSKARKRDEN
jgi:hypothetical protein